MAAQLNTANGEMRKWNEKACRGCPWNASCRQGQKMLGPPRRRAPGLRMTLTPAAPNTLRSVRFPCRVRKHVLGIPGASTAGPGSRYSSNSREAWDEALNEKTRRRSWETPPGIKHDPYSSRAARPPDFAQEDVQGGKNRKNKNGATARTTSRSRTTREQTTLSKY